MWVQEEPLNGTECPDQLPLALVLLCSPETMLWHLAGCLKQLDSFFPSLHHLL